MEKGLWTTWRGFSFREEVGRQGVGWGGGNGLASSGRKQS